jgi:hypothetical protein
MTKEECLAQLEQRAESITMAQHEALSSSLRARGEMQKFCLVCERWRWTSDRCQLFQPAPNQEPEE